MRVVEATDNPWFDIGAFVIELDEDEYRILKCFADTLGRDIHDVLRDALMLTLAKYIHLVLPQDKNRK